MVVVDRPFTFGSLFSGIGGIDLGLERAGMTCEWQVENDAYATKVLAKHWSNTPRFGDIRGVGSNELVPVDLIAGGFPCQDISNAGKRAGITGERSGLWSEFYRLICELRPRYVLVENVAALLYRGINRVLGDLAESGYDAEWQMLSAESVGAPHLRERIFIVAYPQRPEWRAGQSCRNVSNRQNAEWQETAGRSGASGEDGRSWDVAHPMRERQSSIRYRIPARPSDAASSSGTAMAHADRQSLALGEVFGVHAAAQLTAFERDCSTGTGQWAVEPNVGRVAHGVPRRVDRLRGLGNAVVPQVAEYIGRLIMQKEEDSHD